MTEKSVREMSARQRRRHSLASRVFRVLTVHSLLLGLLCFLIGLGMYLDALMQRSMREAGEAAQSTLARVCVEVDPGVYAARTLEIFRQQGGKKPSEEEEAAYYASFAELSEDAGYQRMRELLRSSRTEEMSDNFLAVADAESGVLIFVVDTDPRPDHEYPLGKVMKVPAFVQRIFFSGRDGFPRMYYIRPGRGLYCVSGGFIREGDPSAGFLFTMSKAQESLHGVWRFTLRYVIAIVAAVLILGTLFIYRTRKTLVQPINSIAEAAGNYARDKRSGAAGTEHFSRLDIHTGDEVENLSLTMADMERELAAYEADLTAVTAEKERIATELNLASNIQAHMLPTTFPAFPERKEFDIYASMTPAKEVGGDFYDFFMVNEDHLALVMADVSGKGVPAALFMMASLTMLKGTTQAGLDPAAVLDWVNGQICENNPDCMFVTVWLGILEISTGLLTWSDAGHERLMLWQDGAWKCLPKKSGVALGALEPELLALKPGPAFQNHELILKPGDAVFQYTDGVTEAMTDSREQFGMDRLAEALGSAGTVKPDELLPHVREAIDAFVQGAPQFDDITMLSLLYRGKD